MAPKKGNFEFDYTAFYCEENIQRLDQAPKRAHRGPALLIGIPKGKRTLCQKTNKFLRENAHVTGDPCYRGPIQSICFEILNDFQKYVEHTIHFTSEVWRIPKSNPINHQKKKELNGKKNIKR